MILPPLLSLLLIATAQGYSIPSISSSSEENDLSSPVQVYRAFKSENSDHDEIPSPLEESRTTYSVSAVGPPVLGQRNSYDYFEEPSVQQPSPRRLPFRDFVRLLTVSLVDRLQRSPMAYAESNYAPPMGSAMSLNMPYGHRTSKRAKAMERLANNLKKYGGNINLLPIFMQKMADLDERQAAALMAEAAVMMNRGEAGVASVGIEDDPHFLKKPRFG